MNYGWLSLVPPLLAFLTRETVISLAIACLVGVLFMGQGIVGFPYLFLTNKFSFSTAFVLFGSSSKDFA